MAATEINMLISPDYCPNWSGWETIREFAANARDADKDYSIVFPDENSVEIITKTNPTISNLMMIGSGTKSENTDTIGTFGEGLKIAALTACRSGMNLAIRVPQGEITFEMKQSAGFEEDSLHAKLDKSKPYNGCLITFNYRGIENIYHDKIKPDMPYGMIAKDEYGPMKVYCRGIFIAELDDNSAADWNLRDLKLNRDRNVPEYASLRQELAIHLKSAIIQSNEIIFKMLDHSNCFENQCVTHTDSDPQCCQRFVEGFKLKYGEKAVKSCNNARINQIAEYNGYPVIDIPQLLGWILRSVQSAVDVLKIEDEYEFVDSSKFKKEIDLCYKLMNTLDVGSADIKVFKPNEETMGFCKNNVIGLSEHLFKPGNRLDLFRTFFHEMGHRVGGGDATFEFERSLDLIGGKLALALLEKS